VEDYDDDLRFAHVLADAADDISTRRFRALDLRVETKPDLTPVSDADKATEDAIRNILRRSRPRDAVLGEESGRTGRGPRCWVIDPIDGTKNYVRGVPVWATLIGLMDGDEVVAGVVSAPALGKRWWASAGGGAWTGRSLAKASRMQVSGVTKLGDASFSYSGVGGWAQAGRLGGFLSLTRSVWRTRAFGDFWRARSPPTVAASSAPTATSTRRCSPPWASPTPKPRRRPPPTHDQEVTTATGAVGGYGAAAG
jgi:histidinol-phosphatase